MPLSLMCYFPIIASEAWNPWMMLFYIFIIWANDVFAYLVGMSIGRHRLCERLSPKKSWEGFFGGIIGAVAMGLVAARCWRVTMPHGEVWLSWLRSRACWATWWSRCSNGLPESGLGPR